MRRSIFAVLFACAVLAPASTSYGQGGTSSTLSGVVTDAGGGVVPGANIVVKHNATGTTQSGVTNSQGVFSFPGLNVGAYTVTVSLDGFKTIILNDVVLTSGAPASVRPVLEVGGLTEQVVVISSAEIVQTQSSTVSTTLNTNQIIKLPLTSRSAMDFVNFLPGVSTPGGNRQATINGLPRGTINITLDGVNIQDNTLRSTDGFFAIVSPRLDAVEEVTVTTAAQGADGSGQGAAQVKFVTRSGTNKFAGSGYYYYRNDGLNANTWFNNRNGVAKAKLLQNQYGFRVGGPIVIPKLFDGHGRAFFFVNYEEFHQPSDVTRNRTVLNTAAQQGIFSYQVASGVQTVNLLQLAAANGQLATVDPLIGKLLTDIRNSTTTTGSLTDIDVNLQRFSYNVPVKSDRRFPTFRIDWNLTQKHRFSTAFNYQKFTDYPDTLNSRDANFPGFPVAAGQSSIRKGWSNALRSTLSSSMVNEARVGYSGSPVVFFGELTTSMWKGTPVADQGGFQLTFPSVTSTLTSPSASPAPQARNAASLLAEDTLTWLKGTHSISMGASFTQYTLWARNSAFVPTLNFGLVNSDPALGLFNAANFPGASGTVLTAAQNLYALLTGRVTQITGDARLDESTGGYSYMGTGIQRARMRETGLFVQDSWRLKPNFTINAGLRYELQLPFYPLNSSYTTATMDDVCGISGVNAQGTCNLFQPNATGGKSPVFVQYKKGTPAYNSDRNNFAPSIGFAWSPHPKSGLFNKLVGQDDFVVRAGYTRSYSRNGLTDFSTPFNNNPGVVISATRSDALGNLLTGGAAPLLFRDTARLGAPAFDAKPIYPMTDVVTQDVNIFDKNIQVPSADTWTAGIQRSVGRNTAVEVRYVGTRSRDGWAVLNYNEVNIFENGFLNEFKLAQANLQANIAAGRGNTFAFTGAAGTAPLPTFLAFFNRLPASQASNAAGYTGTNWTNNTFLNFLAQRNPNPFGFASVTGNGLMANATFRANAVAAGIPANYFVVNPDLLGGGRVTSNLLATTYNSMQLEVRRRLSGGLQLQSSYVFGKSFESAFSNPSPFTFRRPVFLRRDTGTPGDITHTIKANVVYDLPFGRGRRYGSSANGTIDRLIGGWQLGLTAIVRSGTLVDMGNVRPVGMTANDVRKMFKLRFDDAGRKVWMLPQEVIDNTILAFSISPTTATGYSGNSPTGRYFAPANGPDCIEVDSDANYGECAARSLVVTGPLFRVFDLRLSKRTELVGRTNLEFAIEALNVFNVANFTPVGGIVNGVGSNIANYEVTGLTGTNGARVIQLVGRFNW